MAIEDVTAVPDLTHHQLSWTDFDKVARGSGGAEVVLQLRHAERSRRLLLLRALVDQATALDLAGPLPPAEAAWSLLERVQREAPAALDLILAHPYTGTWLGRTTRLLRARTDGVLPEWMHVGHLHALAAAAAIRAGMEFEAHIPVWHGNAVLPTLGLARLSTAEPCSVAHVRAARGAVWISDNQNRISVPYPYSVDSPGWRGVRTIVARTGPSSMSLRLDDVDPYRGFHGPVSPEMLDDGQVATWGRLLDEAWRLLVTHVPDLAGALAAGLDSVVPRPPVPFRSRSASTEEAFGSAVITQPPDATSFAAALVHEFQHIRLGGLLHMTRLYEDDRDKRFYVPWRDDPRPIAGVIQGVYAFFGMTVFWRALARADTGTEAHRTALFEFAYRRWQTQRTLDVLRGDRALTPTGSRFVAIVAEQLSEWQGESVPSDIADAVATATEDHYAGWRIRHLRPSPDAVAALGGAWLAGRPPPISGPIADPPPVSVSDGAWSRARTDLIRLGIVSTSPSSVPDATVADVALVDGRLDDAVHGYRAELAADADRPASWIGLGLALSRLDTGPAGRTILHRPELVRMVYRTVRAETARPPAPDDLAAWVGLTGN